MSDMSVYISELCDKYLAAKKAEAKAKQERLAVEAALVQAVGEVEGLKEEGRTKYTAPYAPMEGHDIEVEINRVVARSVDEKAYAMYAHNIPASVRNAVFPVKHSVDVRAYRQAIQDGKLSATIDSIVKESHRKPSVSVKILALV